MLKENLYEGMPLTGSIKEVGPTNNPKTWKSTEEISPTCDKSWKKIK
jgi:hypothetical protein